MPERAFAERRQGNEFAVVLQDAEHRLRICPRLLQTLIHYSEDVGALGNSCPNT